MNFGLTDEQQMLVETVRAFVANEIVPLEGALEPDAGELQPADSERLSKIVKEMGLYAIDVPPAYGGPELDTVTRSLLAIEMAQHRAGLSAPCYGVFGVTGPGHLYEATEDQKERFLYPTLRGEKKSFFGLTEASGGSDPAGAIKTRAVLDGDEWVINGSKMWISGANYADYGLVFARTGDGKRDITCFIVETNTPGFAVWRVIPTLREPHTPTEITFTNMRIPDANRLGGVNQGFSLANDRLSRNRIPYAAGCLGVAIAAQRMAVIYARQREVFGAPLADHGGIQWMLVDNELDLRSARFAVLEAAWRADQRKPFRTEAAAAKIIATEAASRVVDRSIQIHGAFGVSKDLPLERWYRELRIRRIGEGPTEVQKMIIARDLLRGPR